MPACLPARQRWWIAFALTCVLGVGAPVGPCVAAAQANLDLFQPSPGPTITPAVPSVDALDHTSVAAGVWTSYAHGVSDPTDHDRPLRISDLAVMQLHASVGLWERLSLGVVVPVGLVRVSLGEPAAFGTHLGPGDLRAQVALSAVRSEQLALLLLSTLSFPTGDAALPLGSRSLSWTPALGASVSLGPVQLGMRLGYHVRPDRQVFGVELADELRAVVGAAIGLLPQVDGFVEIAGRAGIGGERMGRPEQTLESLLGARLWASDRVSAQLAIGTGAFPLPHGYGTPDVRVLLGIMVRLPRLSGDRRGRASASAGLVRDDDSDDDGDGVAGVADRCPRLAEDDDGFEDGDGCPEPDNDRDGVPDAQDACPQDPEDADDFEDADGCPEPGPEPLAVTITDTQILVSDRIYFEAGEDVIRAVSTQALDRVAEAIDALSAAKRVHVVGHTDRAGDAEANRDLSYRRARAVVEYLKGRGIPESRLSFEGVGGEQPLVEGSSAEARAMNRRVDFHILLPGQRPPGAP